MADYRTSLGWQALQAMLADEQRKKAAFAQKQLQDREAQDKQFTNQMSIIEGLRGNANEQHKRDIETARLAGEVAGQRGEVAPSFEGGRMAQEAELAGAGIFEKLRRADEEKKASREHSLAMQDRLDSRAKENREFQGDLQIGLANLTADRMGDRNLTMEEIARIRADAMTKSAQIRKSGGAKPGPGEAGWSRPANAQLEKDEATMTRARELVAHTYNSVSDQELQAASDYMSRADNAVLRLMDRLEDGDSLSSEEKDQINGFISTNTRLASLFNQMGLARGGKVLTGNEIQRLGLEFPRPGDSAVAMRQKMRTSLGVMDQDLEVIRRLRESGPGKYEVTPVSENPGASSLDDAINEVVQ